MYRQELPNYSNDLPMKIFGCDFSYMVVYLTYLPDTYVCSRNSHRWETIIKNMISYCEWNFLKIIVGKIRIICLVFT